MLQSAPSSRKMSILCKILETQLSTLGFNDKKDFYPEQVSVKDTMSLKLYLEMMKTICLGNQAQKLDINRLILGF